MPDQPAPSHAEGPEPAPPTPRDPNDCDIVPGWDVRTCMVCGKPMEGRKCKYICRSCGTMIDCSDAY
jgi:hypothetical protein